ncbi:MAG: GCN5-related N-acetyltransferase, partial [Nocardioidaceae bacterium]|nr:GCN5-related N-acetyltransferase [Nocardioidaceae bacterium]
AELDDLDGLVASHARLFAEDAAARDPLRDADWPRAHGAQWCADLIDDPDALVLVAVAGNAVVGHLVGTLSPPSPMWLASRAELVSTHVDSTQRGLGIGGRLVAEFRSWAASRGAARVEVSAYAANDGALRFYRRHGFVPHTVDLVGDV